MYSKDFINLTLSQFVTEIYKGSVHILRNYFFPDFWPLPLPFVIKHHQVLSLLSLCQHRVNTSPALPLSASCLNQYMISRTRMLLFGIIFVLYCCFIQWVWLESRLMRNLFTFPDLTFSFQFSYRLFIFCCIIFNSFLQFLSSFKLQLLFHIKIFLLVCIK